MNPHLITLISPLSMLHIESIDHAFGVDTVETWLDLLPAPGRSRARWLPLRAHFFVRPHYGQLVLIDLDDYADTLDRLLRLQPRAIVETSPGSVQLWLTIDMRHAPKDALTVTRELTHSLHGDPACIRTTQVGRMPGSIKPETWEGQHGAPPLLRSSGPEWGGLPAGDICEICAPQAVKSGGLKMAHWNRWFTY